MALGVGREGIKDHESNLIVRIMVLLLSPVDPPESHLKMLGVISRMAGDDRWRKNVVMAMDSLEVLRIINIWEEEQHQHLQIVTGPERRGDV